MASLTTAASAASSLRLLLLLGPMHKLAVLDSLLETCHQFQASMTSTAQKSVLTERSKGDPFRNKRAISLQSTEFSTCSDYARVHAPRTPRERFSRSLSEDFAYGAGVQNIHRTGCRKERLRAGNTPRRWPVRGRFAINNGS